MSVSPTTGSAGISEQDTKSFTLIISPNTTQEDITAYVYLEPKNYTPGSGYRWTIEIEVLHEQAYISLDVPVLGYYAISRYELNQQYNLPVSTNVIGGLEIVYSSDAAGQQTMNKPS